MMISMKFSKKPCRAYAICPHPLLLGISNFQVQVPGSRVACHKLPLPGPPRAQKSCIPFLLGFSAAGLVHCHDTKEYRPPRSPDSTCCLSNVKTFLLQGYFDVPEVKWNEVESNIYKNIYLDLRTFFSFAEMKGMDTEDRVLVLHCSEMSLAASRCLPFTDVCLSPKKTLKDNKPWQQEVGKAGSRQRGDLLQGDIKRILIPLDKKTQFPSTPATWKQMPVLWVGAWLQMAGGHLLIL